MMEARNRGAKKAPEMLKDVVPRAPSPMPEMAGQAMARERTPDEREADELHRDAARALAREVKHLAVTGENPWRLKNIIAAQEAHRY
jgi:hypothetical protein